MRGYPGKCVSVTKFGSVISDSFPLKEGPSAPVQVRVIQKRLKTANAPLIPKEDARGCCDTESHTTALHLFYPALAGKR